MREGSIMGKIATILISIVLGAIGGALIGGLIAGGPGMVLGGAGLGFAIGAWSLQQFA